MPTTKSSAPLATNSLQTLKRLTCTAQYMQRVKLGFGSAKPIALTLLMGCMGLLLLNPSSASGGGGALLSVQIRSGVETQAVMVGLGILFAVYALIVFEWVHRTLAAAIGGLVAVFALHLYSVDPISLPQVATMVDWNTIGLLLGMMIMVGVLSRTGVFEWLAVRAFAMSKGNVWGLTVILCTVTAVLSAFLDNVTTMLLLTPVTIQLARVLDIKPIPLLIAEVMFSNIGGTATLIGDPPNIIIGNQMSEASLATNYPELASQAVGFNDFIINLAPGVLLTVVPTFMLLRWLYSEELGGRRDRDIKDLEEQYAIKDFSLLKRSGAVLGLVIIGFFSHAVTHINVTWIALGGATLMLLVTSRHELEDALEKVEWSTLLFFAGLFVLVHSLDYMGVISYIGDKVASTIAMIPAGDDGALRLAGALILILWVSAVVSAFIDNIPYTATMVPVIASLAMDADLGLELGPLVWALAFGACLGGNGTLIGASANVVTAGLSEEAGYPISFNEFFIAGFPVMILTTAIVSIYVILVYVMEFEIWMILIATIIMIAAEIMWERRPGVNRWFPDEDLANSNIESE